ncbi:hypothetical protein [Sanguibacter sp. 25GB23B1]|uniref:hypothetical protein n=1 Tax=unclassified Sanguibacter TaxID=2645534 RepID=UPI0032AECDB4
MSEDVGLHGLLRHAASGASLEVPRGWRVVEDVGAVTCEAPSGRADVTGRVVAARISIEMIERHGLVPLRQVDVVVRDLVADALADHPHAWLLDCVPWPVPWDDRAPAARPSPEGVRVDVAHHDMSTPLVVSTVLVALDAGLLRVTASLPVAHQRALGAAVDDALDSLRLAAGAPATEAPSTGSLSLVKASFTEASASTTARDMADVPLAYSSPRTWMTADALEVFVTGSHKIAARWRPEPLAAGLIDARGVATPLGGFVRRAVSRPDARAALTVYPVELGLQADARGATEVLAAMTVDRLDGYAVLRATPPPVRTPATPFPVLDHVSLEVVDVAAAPARAAAWLGVGPGRAAELPDGTLAVLGTARSAAPGVRAEHAGVIVSALPGPRQVWVRLLDALG